MTVAELIKELQDIPETEQNLPIFVYEDEGDWAKLRDVRYQRSNWRYPNRIELI